MGSNLFTSLLIPLIPYILTPPPVHLYGVWMAVAKADPQLLKSVYGAGQLVKTQQAQMCAITQSPNMKPSVGRLEHHLAGYGALEKYGLIVAGYLMTMLLL